MLLGRVIRRFHLIPARRLAALIEVSVHGCFAVMRPMGSFPIIVVPVATKFLFEISLIHIYGRIEFIKGCFLRPFHLPVQGVESGALQAGIL